MAEIDKLNVPPTTEDTETALMLGVAWERHTELADTREDIYTLDGGEPSMQQRTHFAT